MSNDFEQSTLSQALADARSVYAVVASMPGQPYANHFRQLVSSLETGNFEEAVRIRSALPFAGMGGFGEFFESTPAIQKPYRSLLEQIGALKLHSRYGLIRNEQHS